MKKLYGPLTKEKVLTLRLGQEVLYTGIMYTMRDQAHKRLMDQTKAKKSLPFDLKGQIAYYCGPTKTPLRRAIGSCGPTTSSRMDRFTPGLLRLGLKAMIGKGFRSKEIISAVKKYKAVYFLAPAGCGALLSQKVVASQIIAYKDLGPEAIRKLVVKDFPLVVGIDSYGRDIYGT